MDKVWLWSDVLDLFLHGVLVCFLNRNSYRLVLLSIFSEAVKLTYEIFMMKSVLTPFSMKLESLPQFIHSSNIHSIFFWLLFSRFTNTYMLYVCVLRVYVCYQFAVWILNLVLKSSSLDLNKRMLPTGINANRCTFFPFFGLLICISHTSLLPEQFSSHFYYCSSKEFTEYNQSVDTYFDSLRA